MRFVLFVLLLLIQSNSLFSANGYMFRIQLKDKGKTSYTINNPKEFLSEKSIERRLKQGIQIDSSDLPISENYIDSIQNLGYTVVAKSKWLSTVCVLSEDSIWVDKIRELTFVDDVMFVWKSDTIVPEKNKRSPVLKKTKSLEKSQTKYGYAFDQIKTLNGGFLHEKGYTGKDVEIAIIDAGYQNLDEILLLDNVGIQGMKDFVYEGGDILQSSDHGLKVLSVLGANRPGVFVGTAPDAKYWLLRSEDGRSEYPIEEDYWIAAAEYADSLGVDIINTSLGYYNFHAPAKSYQHNQLDGKTAHISRGANVATRKGIFIEVSAANEGAKPWRKIAFPADVEHVLTVGSMTRDSIVSSFSSRGLSEDGRVKPDVVALGSKINVIASSGEIESSNGTSFAGPVMSGLVACLWQAFPDLTSLQLLDIIRQSANKYDNPDVFFGYGIPNMERAFELANKITLGKEDDIDISQSEIPIIDSYSNR